MESPALVAGERAPDDEVRHEVQVTELEEVRGNVEVPVVLPDLLLDKLTPSERSLKPLVRPDNTDVVPHEATDLIPVLFDNDLLVATRR